MPQQNQDSLLERARKYSFLKYSLAILDTVYLVILLLLFTGLGLSGLTAGALQKINAHNYFLIPAYLLVVSLCCYLVSLPLNFYRSYVIEHKFSLSTQNLPGWLSDQAKSGIISYSIGLISVSAFYYILAKFPVFWWLALALFWIFFSFILARLTPVLIVPLFFKYRELSDQSLRQRILALAAKMKIEILDCFEIDFSKKTLKANAAFLGWGKSRRVVLADTLKDKYTHDEIEAIVAHEFAHYKLKHLLKLILINSFSTIICFYIISKTNPPVLKLFGLDSLSNIAALPVVFLYFVLFGIIMQPLEAYISRAMERNADKMALEVTGLKSAFISMMEKLAAQNLADKSPHPVIKFFFFDHPPIDERIKMAQLK